MPKERENSLDRIKKKLRKLERKLRTRSRTRSRSPTRYWDSAEEQETAEEVPERPEPTETEETPAAGEEKPVTAENIECVDLTEKAEISDEILELLGEAPQEVKYGPELLPQLCTRWQAVIKKGLDKEEKSKLIKKYPPPANCKILDAPKLNPEAQAAAGEHIIKRDKAIEAKQRQVSSAIAAIGLALSNLCKSPTGNKETITLLSDSARLLCDYHFNESATRKSFLITGLENKTAREAIKDTEVDQWLFGENLAEKLKASKAIERSSKDLKGPANKPKKVQPSSHLNYKGPSNNVYKPKGQGQRAGFQPYQKRQPGNTAARPYPPKTQPKPYQQHHNSRR